MLNLDNNGLIGGMPFADYQALDAVNWSSAKHMMTSPLEYRYRLDNPQEETQAMLLGRAAHTMILEPDRALLDLALWEGGRRYGKAWDEFVADHPGKTVVKPDEHRRLIGMRQAVHGHPVAREYLRNAMSEQTVVWDDDTGLKCKARIDACRAACIVDLKTTQTVDARVFGRLAGRMRYHNQMAWYRDGMATVTDTLPHNIEAVIIAVEQEPPHDVGVFLIEADVLDYASDENAEVRRRIKACGEADSWPGRHDEMQPLALPEYLFDVEDELIFEED